MLIRDQAASRPRSVLATTSGSETVLSVTGRHIPALDGFRGLAILLVMVFHGAFYGGLHPSIWIDRWMVSLMDSCWVGVDLFFVLSGFLITGLLLDSRGHRHQLRNFYARRVLRIMPLYYAVLTLCFGLIPRLFPVGPAYQAALNEQAWYWSFLLNVRIGLLGWTAYLPLGHFWSLAVEEQFYLAWAFVVHWTSRQRLLAVCLLMVVLGFLVRIVCKMLGFNVAAYVLMPARMDTLAVGGLLALLVRRPLSVPILRRWGRRIAGLAGLALALLLGFRNGLRTDDPAVYTIGFSLLALFFGALLLLALCSPAESCFGRLLNRPILRFLGRYSYGLYVWHHLVVLYLPTWGFSAASFPRLAGSQLPGLLGFGAVEMGLSILLALLSWHLLEAPFLVLKRFFGPDVARRGVRPDPVPGR